MIRKENEARQNISMVRIKPEKYHVLCLLYFPKFYFAVRFFHKAPSQSKFPQWRLNFIMPVDQSVFNEYGADYLLRG